LADSTNTNVGGSKKKGASSVLTGVQRKFSRTKRHKLCSVLTQNGVKTASEISPIDIQANVRNFCIIIISTQSELIA